MKVAKKFDAATLLAAPRRSSAVPNRSGTLALYTVSAYCFDKGTKTGQLRLLDLQTKTTTVVIEDKGASEPVWLEDDTFAYLLSGEKGAIKLVVSNTSGSDTSHVITTFDGPVGNLKVARLNSNGIFALSFTGQTTPDGALFNPETVEKPKSSVKVYDSLFVRQWDAYVENRNSIWVGELKKSSDGYTLSDMTNILTNSKQSLESPVPPFGGADSYDISKEGIVFIAKDPRTNGGHAAMHTITDPYFIKVNNWNDFDALPAQQIITGGLRGYSGSPVFSPNAKSLAFTRMKSDIYESDKPRLLVIPDILADIKNVQEFFDTEDGNGAWDIRPDAIVWSHDGQELYVTAEVYGRVRLYKIPASPRHVQGLPVPLSLNGSVKDVKVLGSKDDVLLTTTSLIDSSTFSTLNTDTQIQTTISSASRNGKAFGLSRDQISEIEFAGSEGHKVHAWMIKPSTFDPQRKYPLAYLIHGGPQGAWTDSWSTRWNPALFAEQGYVVVTPNPTGSTGYGMAFQNRIRTQWGGHPYEDLVKGFEHLETIPYLDTDRAVALGASYGGYMMNWIQGHALGRKFKALVTHDGVFSTLNQWASDELFFPVHDFGGTLWEKYEEYERWNPASAECLGQWATPHLIIHSEKDYRLPISEGLAPFNVLQVKGVPSRFVMFPDENHWVLQPENSLRWHKEVFDWINKYSGVSGI